MNTKADYSSISRCINVSISVEDLSREEKRSLFHSLIRDKDVACGDITYTNSQKLWKLLDKYCGWDK